MKRCCLAIGLLVFVSLIAALPASAQMGMGMGGDLFKRPSFTKMFHPVVGKGAQYLTTDKDGKTSNMEMSIVAKDSVEGKDGFWMEFVMTQPDGKIFIGKGLITGNDFQFHRMVVQPPGQQAMEMPIRPNAMQKQSTAPNTDDWHSVGTESITVPAGTFSCEHWRDDKNNSDVWTSDKVSPFGLVKEVHPGSNTMVLTKVIDNATDRITGPVKQFDMQEMMQQMQQHRQQPQQ
jgi:hypothetical protein